MHPATWAPLTAFAAALLAIAWLLRGRRHGLLLDRPNARSLHESPVPRTGGLGLHAGILIAAGIIAPELPALFWLGYAALLLTSFVDDARGMAVWSRLVIHLTASAFVAAVILGSPDGLPAVALAALAIAWMANLYNFMDGSDGLAGGMALIGFTAYALGAGFAGDARLALLSASIAASAAAFLFFNWPPARVFLGDAGSVPLGFLAATLGLVGWREGHWTAWFPLLVFGPFVVDATVTLARRLARGDRVWEAHRDHYYQRLVLLGWGHRRTALAEYALMAASAALALALLRTAPAVQTAGLVAAAAAYAVLIALVERAWRRRQASELAHG